MVKNRGNEFKFNEHVMVSNQPQTHHPELDSGSIRLIKNHDEAMNKTISIGQSINDIQSLKIDPDLHQDDVSGLTKAQSGVVPQAHQDDVNVVDRCKNLCPAGCNEPVHFKKKAAFTLGELVVAMLVITMVVVITLPITINKMHKVDGISYYMAYSTMADIAANTYDLINSTDDCAFKIGDTCYTGTASYPTALSYNECTSVKSELGLNYCYLPTTTTTSSEKDYFAGAALACGGVSNLPTPAQLTELANYLYNTSSISSSSATGGLTLDTDKASALGFTLNISGFFVVWSGWESDNGSTFRRTFKSTSTYCGNPYRSDSSLQAVCVGD